MLRLGIFFAMTCLLAGCKSNQARVSKDRNYLQRLVDVDVSGHHVNVQVRPEGSKKVDVYVAWP